MEILCPLLFMYSMEHIGSKSVDRGVRVTTIGGGTGSFTLLSALKQHAAIVRAIVNMVDDGGSTGLLRDQLGVLPPGDVRQCLVALAEVPEWRDLMSFRFHEGILKGQSFGNIFLSALELQEGSFEKAVQRAQKLLQTTGSVLPVTFDNIRLKLKMTNGNLIEGECNISDASFGHDKDATLFLDPTPILNADARDAILDSDIVTVGPGHLNSSIIPTLLVPGVAEALRETTAKVVYICNLMTKPGQTDGYAVHDFVEHIARYVGQNWCHYVLFNNHTPAPDVLERYARAGEKMVTIDRELLENAPYTAIGRNFVSENIFTQDKADTLLSRTLIRHNACRVAKTLMRIYYDNEDVS